MKAKAMENDHDMDSEDTSRSGSGVVNDAEKAKSEGQGPVLSTTVRELQD